MRTRRLSIRLRLSGLRPTAQRLRELVAAFGVWGYDCVYIDWGDSFPWSLDERLRASDAYREELVSGLVSEASGRGVELESVFPSPDRLEFLERIPTYRRLFRTGSDGPVLMIDSPAAYKLYADLADDFLSLLPKPERIMIDFRPAAVSREELSAAVKAFRERSIPVVVWYRGEAGDGSPSSLSAMKEVDLVVVPTQETGRLLEVEEERSILGFTVTSRSTRSLAAAAIRGGVPVVCSFQAGDEGYDGRTPGRLPTALAGSIERGIEDARFLGGCRGGRSKGDTPQSGIEGAVEEGARRRRIEALEGELEEALGLGWRCVRRAREGLSLRALGGTSRSLPSTVVEVGRAHARAARAAAGLLDELGEVIEASRLSRTLGALTAPLFEEYHLLLARPELGDRGVEDEVRLETEPFSC